MTSASVRRIATASALAAAFTCLPIMSTQAVADTGDEDIVRVKLTGITTDSTAPRYLTSGASWVTYQHLYTPKNVFAGDAGSHCTAVEATAHQRTIQCTRVLRLKKGEITLHDVITHKGNAPITAKTAIAGGTGIYNDAEGEGYITLDGNRILFDLHVDD